MGEAVNPNPYSNGTVFRADRLGRVCTSYVRDLDPVSEAAVLEAGPRRVGVTMHLQPDTFDALGRACAEYAAEKDPTEKATRSRFLSRNGWPVECAPEIAAAYALGGWEAVRSVLESLLEGAA